VIERSNQRWLAALEVLGGEAARALAFEWGTQVAKARLDPPDFLCLGLMLTLEDRPVEPRAIAGADGLFIAKEVGGDSADLIKLFDLHAHLIFESAGRLQSGEPA
jgi:hypothetical protein